MVQWKPNGKSLKRKCEEKMWWWPVQGFTELLNKQLYIPALSSLGSKNINLWNMVTLFVLPLWSLLIWRCQPFPWFSHYQCFSSSYSFQKAVLQLGYDHSACQCTSGPEVISRWCVGICTSFIYLKLGTGKRVSWDITPPSPGRLGEEKQIIHGKYHLHRSNTFIALLPNPNEGRENVNAIQTFIKWELCSPFKDI